jgi:ubiquinone/menaquinone biosynthesis C-methylase UbiE
MASLYDRLILPRLISASCGGPAVTKMRAKVTPRAQGRVLELGIGAGANLRFYDPAKVSAVFAVEPSEALRKRARVAEGPPGLPITILNGQAEALPFDGGEFDTVVCTFTLCSVASPEIALSEARRVLKRGGRLLFCEHGLSPDAGVARWQGRIEPVWKAIAGGCHLTRRVAPVIAGKGFRIESRDARYMRGVPRFAGWCEWGSAVPA